MDVLQLIQRKIYEIRGQKVMLDFDLAEMYEVETRVLNQAVKRNIERFPPDFMFQMTKDEWQNMSSQFVMTSRNKRPKTAIPLAFTEHGVVMLSSVLRSNIAIQTSVLIVRAFVAIRQLAANPPADRVGEQERQMQELRNYMEEVFADYNDINEDTRCSWSLSTRRWLSFRPGRRLKRNRVTRLALHDGRKDSNWNSKKKQILSVLL